MAFKFAASRYPLLPGLAAPDLQALPYRRWCRHRLWARPCSPAPPAPRPAACAASAVQVPLRRPLEALQLRGMTLLAAAPLVPSPPADLQEQLSGPALARLLPKEGLRLADLGLWVGDAILRLGPLAGRLALTPCASYAGWRTWTLLVHDNKNAHRWVRHHGHNGYACMHGLLLLQGKRWQRIAQAVASVASNGHVPRI